ncbi:hypothetical protein ANSO36C_21310 [Nostoc cf. commune SO-36]|uniref:eCIS core domain-containing protein n=1 Tax=Nostoc cf. commune SO-36 TaxID=449208 RepID=A0ABN6Q0T6_NOSCO|nr:DUF4157 domain-containing protein [Nostoc commune]BDI16329.1 hypothetical protein ANSO36C_21310 [Nostoc cf. commune SO-36]
MREYVSRKKQATTGFSIPSLKHPTPGFSLESSAISRQAVPEIQPLPKPITHDISRIPLRSQAKLSISQPGDIYEQEADSVAQQVMQRMAQPVNRQSIQREALPEDEEELQMKSLDISTFQREALPEEEEELQMKSLDSSTLQREALPEDEEELQMKSLDSSTLQREALPEDEEELQMKPMVQRQAEAGMAAAPDLEASINQARGGGVAIADNIREPMEQAFGADFSGVKVHTDGQSDQLNRSIQARAFTTGQDVFFRQGEYNPGSRGGQELLAHELTHVVQQNGGAVMRSPRSPQLCNDSQNKIGNMSIQRLIDPYETQTQFVKRFGDVKNKKGVNEALKRLFEVAKLSPHKYSGNDLAEELHKKGQLTNKNINGLVDDLNKIKSTDMDEDLSGERGHSMARHLTISDKDMENRLRGNNAIPVATRFSTEQNAGRMVMKYYRILSSKVPPLVKQLVRKTCLEVLDIIASDEYRTLPNNNAKRDHLRDVVGLQTTIEEEAFDIQFTWGYAIQPAGVRIRCEYEIRSIEEFVKEQWRLDAESEEVKKNPLDEIATMYSGSNTPVIEVLNTDNEGTLVAKIAASPIDKIGVTLF